MKLKKEAISLVLAGSLVLGGVSYLPNGGAGNVASAADTKEVDLGNLTYTAWWGEHTTGQKLSEQEMTFSYTSTLTEAATDNWHGPVAVLYTSADGKVAAAGTEGYTEYWVVRTDHYGWIGEVNTNLADAMATAGITFERQGTIPADFVTQHKEGLQCEGSVKITDGKAVLTFTVGEVTSISTIPVPANTDVYIALTCDQTNLTNIKFQVPVETADPTSPSATEPATTTSPGSAEIPSNPDGDTNTVPGTISTTSPANSPAASTAPGASTAPSTAPDASQAPSDGDNTPGATQAPSDGDNTPGATQTPSDGDDTPGATQTPDNVDADKNTTSTAPKKQTNVTAAAQNGVTIKVNTKKNGTAVISTIKKTTKKTVTINSTVTVNGVKYKVTTIGAKAFAKCTKATKVNLPSTITTIKKNAFAGAKKLKTIKITSKKAVTVKKGAFKGLSTKKMTIKVSKKNMTKKQFKTTKKNLKNAGFKGTIKRV